VSYGNMVYEPTYGIDYSGSIELFKLFSEIFAFVMVFGLIIGVLSVIIMWKIFEKAGKPGWAALVPFYNMYILFEITWGNGWMFLTMFSTIIPIIGTIVVIVIYIITLVKLAKVFGQNGGFAVGLIFLNLIFMGVLAFSKMQYVGIASNTMAQPSNMQPSFNQQPNMQPPESQQVNLYNQAPQSSNMVNQTMHQNGNNTLTCPYCNSVNSVNTSFCTMCGNKIR